VEQVFERWLKYKLARFWDGLLKIDGHCVPQPNQRVLTAAGWRFARRDWKVTAGTQPAPAIKYSKPVDYDRHRQILPSIAGCQQLWVKTD